MIFTVLSCDHCGVSFRQWSGYVGLTLVSRGPAAVREYQFCSTRCVEQWIKAAPGESARPADGTGQVGDA